MLAPYLHACNADPILSPHMEPRCSSYGASAGEHAPFAFTPAQAGYMFAVSSITFMPISLWVGVKADLRGRDFPFLRRVMIIGLRLIYRATPRPVPILRTAPTGDGNYIMPCIFATAPGLCLSYHYRRCISIYRRRLEQGQRGNNLTKITE